MNLATWKDLLNKRGGFSHEETVALGSVALASAILFFVQDWDLANATQLDIAIAFMTSLIITSLVFFIHHFAQRAQGLWLGVTMKFELWWYGLVGGLALSLLTGGAWSVYAGTATEIESDPSLRLLRFRRYAEPRILGYVIKAGPLAEMFVANLLQNLVQWFPSVLFWLAPFANHFFTFSMFFVFWNILPIPPLDGSKMFFGSRTSYMYLVCFFFAYVLLGHYLQRYSLLLAFLVGVIGVGVYFNFLKENKK